MAITNNQALTLTADPLTVSFCHTSLQDTHEEFANKITVPNIGAAFTASESTPTGTDNDKLWLKLNGSAVPIGWYYWDGSAWTETSVPFTAPTGSYGTTSQIPSVTVDANGRITAASNNTLTATDNVAILTGTVSNTGTIPLPSGYTEGQCKWMVGVGTITASHGDHNSNHNVTFTADSSRVVTTSGIGAGIGSGVANYIIIGVK